MKTTTNMNSRLSLSGALLLAALILLCSLPAFAAGEEDILSLEPTKMMEVYHYPEIPPEVTLGIGYRRLTTDDSKTTPFNEYQYLKRESPMYSLDGRLFRYPDRLLVHFQYNNKNDMFGDASYAYKNLFIIRGLTSKLWHNLDNIRLPKDSVTPDFYTNNLDSPGHEYGISTDISRVSARLKMPDFPAHLFMDYFRVAKEGDRQQRFYVPQRLGAATAISRTAVARGRDIDLLTQEYTVGANSHLGPVEAEYTFSWKDVKSSADDDVMYDNITVDVNPAAGGANFVPVTGPWPHNRYSEIEGYKHTLKMHTNFTGKVVASATASSAHREDVYSGAQVDTTYFAGSVMWQPVTKLNLAARYRYTEADNETPKDIKASGADPAFDNPAYPVLTTVTGIRPSVDTKDKNFNVTGRYRALSWLALMAGYTHDTRERHADSRNGIHGLDWWNNLEDHTKKDEVTVGADIQLTKKYKAKLTYTNTEYETPAYNNQPDRATMYKATLTLMPFASVFAVLGYEKTYEERDDLRWYAEEESDPDITNRTNDRSGEKDHATAILSWSIRPNLVLSGNYSWFKVEIDQDLIVDDQVGALSTEKDVPWESEVSMYGVNLFYSPVASMRFNAGATWLNSETNFKFEPGITFTDPMSASLVEGWSKTEISQQTFYLGAVMDLNNRLTLGVDYKFNDFDQKADNGYDDMNDGSAHLVMVTLKKTLGGGM